jgi:hypothetical protein
VVSVIVVRWRWPRTMRPIGSTLGGACSASMNAYISP